MSNWGDPYQPAGSDRSAAQSQGQQPYAQPPQYGQPPAPTAYGQQPAFGPAPVPPSVGPPAPPYAHAQPPARSADRAFHVAQLDAMHRSADRQAVLIRWVLGIVLLVFVFLRTAGDGVGGVAFGGALTWRWRLRSSSEQSSRVGSPGSVTRGRGGTAGRRRGGGLGRARPARWLSAAAVTPTKVRKSAATSLSMVPSAQEVELWTGRGSTARSRSRSLVTVVAGTIVLFDDDDVPSRAHARHGDRPAPLLVPRGAATWPAGRSPRS